MERDKEHFLFYCFDSKNDCRNFISETSESASVKICEYWFRRLKSGDFNLKDKEHSDQPKKFEEFAEGIIR